ncbi:MAG: hypothetical protein IJV06_02435 [Bacteroidaceae bacterium]|nr:hypothetical protein [Bacteroidaceae bacterium]
MNLIAKIKRTAYIFTVLFWMSSNLAWAGDGAEIVEKVERQVLLLEAFDKTIASVMIDQLSSTSDTRTYTRTLYRGNTYKVVAAGDDHIKDTDLVVYRKSGSSWVEVKRDTDSSNCAVVSFDCNVSGEYKFEVKAYSFEPGYKNAYYGLIIAF